MPDVSKKKAVEALTAEIQKARFDDLAEIHNELFPQKPTTAEQAAEDVVGLTAKILAHVEKGLEIEEILALWHVIFPTHRKIWFDEEKKKLHYQPDEEAVPVE